MLNKARAHLRLFLSRIRIFSRKAGQLKRIRQGWGKRRSLARPIERCKLYEQIDSENLADVGRFSLDSRTRSDLDIDLVFGSIDHATSSPGSQYLYQALVTPGLCAEANPIPESLVELFEADAEVREKAQIELLALDDDTSFSLPKLILENLPKPPLSIAWVRLCSIILPLLIVVAVFEPIIWAAVPVMFFVNLLIHYKYEEVFGYEIDVLASLGRLVRSSANLYELLGQDFPSDDELVVSIKKCLPLVRKCTYVQLRDPTYLLDYLNILTLRKVHAYGSLRGQISSRQKHLRVLFRAIGLIDTCISIASYRRSRRVWCKPEFVDTPCRIHAENLLHPALAHPVGNSFEIRESSILITGSNMSGKTTFLKTVALNAILAQTINTSIASKYEACPFYIKSSIDIADDIESGKSLFAAELDVIQELVGCSTSQNNCLFIVDELFRGTNPVERVAAASAVVQYLAKSNLVLVATHDLAIGTLLGSDFDRYHFSEHYQDGDILFDYCLKPGICKTTNAIELLSRGDFPDELVAQAVDNLKRLTE
ncbi:MAG: hypothetical protein JRF33_05305 [Deltaproteobacteria bacterium]|nr:hypothetical protein [Deltaproteobacteria bacterium]